MDLSVSINLGDLTPFIKDDTILLFNTFCFLLFLRRSKNITASCRTSLGRGGLININLIYLTLFHINYLNDLSTHSTILSNDDDDGVIVPISE